MFCIGLYIEEASLQFTKKTGTEYENELKPTGR